MKRTQLLSVFLAAILVASAFSLIGLQGQQAAAQAGVTIETSADDHGMKFFGNAALQVIIEDDSTDDDGDTISVTVDGDGDTSDSFTFDVVDTFAGSQNFEFYLIHADSTFDTGDLDQDNTADLAPIITFGTGGDIDTGETTFDDVSFDIEYEDETVTVDYEESLATLLLDREEYGSSSIVYVTIDDQDANVNPTGDDDFVVDIADIDSLLELDGGTFDTDITFEETGDNTALFEAEVLLGTNMTADEESLVLELNDKIDYEDVLVNTTNTDTETFTVEDVDGDFTDISDLTFAGELTLSLNDNDQNIDSQDDDTMDDIAGNGDGEVTVTVDNGVAADLEVVPMEETGENTGVFDIDLSNSELPITFLAAGETVTDNNGILELRPVDITEDIIVTYDDPLNDDSEPSETASFTLEMVLVDGTVDLPDTAGINDDFPLTINDADLNNNPRSRDSYTIELLGSGEFPLFRGGNELTDLATLEVDVSSEETTTFAAPALTYTLLETGINTGIFEADIDMGEILTSTGADVDDGDSIEFTYNDEMDDTSSDNSAEVTIGKADAGVEFTRSVVPIPPTGATEDVLGSGTVVVSVVVTDPDQNEESSVEEELEKEDGGGFVFETDAPAGVDGPSFRIEIDGELEGTIDSTPDYTGLDLGGGTTLSDIMPSLPSMIETGDSTGVFDDELEFINPDLDPDVFQDLEFEFIYIDADGDEESAGITFRGNDGFVSVDQPSARAGTLITISVQDEDLNLDDDEAEEFTSTGDGFDEGTDLLSIETEDDDIAGVSEETFRETGTDTGIFEATFEVGDDIPITEQDGDEINQATNILITYNDETDSTGDDGDEIEINVPIASSTGSIQVAPELVGPGTILNVLIVDADLDEDSGATDDYDAPADPDSEDHFVSFRSDRDEVDEAGPDLEETGPNTGVFSFELELLTDASACADDDLDSDDFSEVAEGGSEPSIGACPGDLISISYEDENDANGRSTTVSEVIEVMAWDPEFVSDKDSYSVGDRVTVTISDPDANTDPDIADSLTEIRVSSDSDAVGEEFSAIETGPDTGVFRLSFLASSSSESGAITVKTGDDVTIEYTDEFPADFEEQEEDKDFTFTISIGGRTDADVTTPTSPTVQSSTGQPLSEVTVGQQVVLTTTIVNNVEENTPFVGLVEVRDSNDVTTYLAWQTGELSPNGRANIGLSWTPDFSGVYTVRTFVITDLDSPDILSGVVESDVTVS